MEKGWKSKRIEEILISLICVWLEWKHAKMRKMNLYKFTSKPLIKKIKIKTSPIKTKKWQTINPKRKDNHSNLLKNKNHACKRNKSDFVKPPLQKVILT